MLCLASPISIPGPHKDEMEIEDATQPLLRLASSCSESGASTPTAVTTRDICDSCHDSDSDTDTNRNTIVPYSDYCQDHDAQNNGRYPLACQATHNASSTSTSSSSQSSKEKQEDSIISHIILAKLLKSSSLKSAGSMPALDTSTDTHDNHHNDYDDTSMSSSTSSDRASFNLQEEACTTSPSTPDDNHKVEMLAQNDSSNKNKAHTHKHKYLPFNFNPFTLFRLQYLIVHTAIMLADGLQGTHLYVLYEGYGYSVSSLYSLGFVAGAFTSPFIGPIVDKIGRKKAAMLYCVLEMFINYLELFPIFAGLIASRVIGGITTNLLFSVFESWLVSEHRSRGFGEEKLETILRDSTIVSNSAAILSGYLAHCLATNFGAVGPFQGAVVLTCVALILVWAMWTENYGTGNCSSDHTTWKGNMVGAYNTIVNDSKISRIGLIQGFTEGSLQTFVFLWSPALRAFAKSAPKGALGIDTNGEPAYGLIFGAFMACGVLGGFGEPMVRRLIKKVTTVTGKRKEDKIVTSKESTSEGEEETDDEHAVDFLCTICYLASALLFLTPVLVKKDSPHSFTICVGAFLFYELMVGLYMPCEGMIRSIYMPNESICSLMTMLRVIVNVAVAVGVASTNYVPFTNAFAALSVMMVIAAALQISLVPRNDLAKMLAKFVPRSRIIDGKKVKTA